MRFVSRNEIDQPMLKVLKVLKATRADHAQRSQYKSDQQTPCKISALIWHDHMCQIQLA